MRIIKDFSSTALKQIRWWAWAAAVLPISSLAGLFFIWAFGTKSLYNLSMVVGATAMFSIAAIWWWWIIWTVSRILKKDRKVANELKNAANELSNIKSLVKETFGAKDK